MPPMDMATIRLGVEVPSTVISTMTSSRPGIIITEHSCIADAALRALEAGYDGVEIHCAQTFSEYLKYYPSENIDAAFEDYYDQGGMSGSYLYHNKSDAGNYIRGIFRARGIYNPWRCQ